MAHNDYLSDTAVTFEDVTVIKGDAVVLDSIKASVPKGVCTAIVGPNGAGKTTLLLALLGQIAYKGRILFTGQTKSSNNIKIGYVPQRMSFDRGIPLTVAEFLTMGVQRSPLWFGIGKQVMNRCRCLLECIGARHLEKRKLGALSGGEMQRVLLALALQQKPDLLVLDEPSAGVDLQGGQLLCELLDCLRKQRGFTQIMVSHDLVTVTHHANHVIALNRCVITEGPPKEVLTNENLTRLFGLHMGLVDSRAMPEGGTVCSASCCREDCDF